MEALAYSKELSIPRMEASLGLHYMKASANGFGSNLSRQEKMSFGAAAVCLSRRPLLFCRQVCPAQIKLCELCVVLTRLASSLSPSNTITAATADLAYFPPLCLLCKLDVNSLVGGLLFSCRFHLQPRDLRSSYIHYLLGKAFHLIRYHQRRSGGWGQDTTFV